MCISIWHTFPDSSNQTDLKFILAFNRDETYSRKTALLHKWTDKSVMGGRDMHDLRVKLGDNGTWLGLDPKSGRISFLTNIMLPRVDLTLEKIADPAKSEKSRNVSRGMLIPNLLDVNNSVEEHLRELNPEDYTGEFNLMATNKFFEVSGQLNGQFKTFETGVCHAVTNQRDPGCCWDKAARGKKLLQKIIDETTDEKTVKKTAVEIEEEILEMMENMDSTEIDSKIVEQHGLSENEEQNKELFKFFDNYGKIYQEHHDDFLKGSYGTRSTTVILVFQDRSYRIVERSRDLANNVILEGTVVKSQRDGWREIEMSGKFEW
jgi:uncharacterized protein with NRDE domain